MKVVFAWERAVDRLVVLVEPVASLPVVPVVLSAELAPGVIGAARLSFVILGD